MKRPAFQFYPGDWQRNIELRACSVGARGLWIEMICIMHQAEPYGYLVLNGKPITPTKLANITGGATLAEVTRWLAELQEEAVFSIDAEGRMFSRRMVRDEELRTERAEGGKLGAEHGIKGKDHGQKGGRPRNKEGSDKPPIGAQADGVNHPPLEPPPSSSSSASSSTSKNRVEDSAHARTCGEACAAMREEGITHVNPSHPDLLALITTHGCKPKEFGDMARELKLTNPGKPMAYVLKAMQTRIDQAVSRKQAYNPNAKPGKRTEDFAGKNYEDVPT